MGEQTKIEWADMTFNPWVGCTKVSAACDNCYAESWALRTGGAHLWQGERRRTTGANWRQPLKWDRQAAADGVRRRVFCASLADVFDNQVPTRWRDDLWHLIALTPHLDWLLLTKRPQNIAKMLPTLAAGHRPWGEGWPNVWFGTTAENQEEADRRLPHLLATPAARRFVSAEPLLGPVDLMNLDHLGALREQRVHGISAMWKDNHIGRSCLDWVIVGGESGPGARPMHPDWARSIRDQCAAAGVPFFFKQWGEWLPWEPEPAPCWRSQRGHSEDGHALFPANMDEDPRWDDGLWGISQGLGHAAFQRVGKKVAGRVLDGVTHDAVPV